MKKKLYKTLLGALLSLVASPLWAEHGTLSSTLRDNWINLDVTELVSAGVLPATSAPVNSLTNLQVAQLTAKAADILVAQANLLPPPSLPGGDVTLPGSPLSEPQAPSALQTLPPPALGTSSLPGGLPGGLPGPATTQSISQLVEEFKNELAAMGEDLPQIEDQIYALQHHNDSLAQQQQALLQRTGTQGSGYSRGYFYEYRGFGANAYYSAATYNSMIFMDMNLRSVPVPGLLFNTSIRFMRTDGDYYADPWALYSQGPGEVQLRWLALTDFNEIFSLNAGDFYQHYTPLTLWNNGIPVYTLIEPTSYYRVRKDVEDLVFIDHEPDYRLRGFQISSNVAWPDSPALSYFNFQAMGGPIKEATSYQFGDYFAGSESSISFFGNNLELKGTGLLIWDDPGTASQPYQANNSLTWARQYQIGSLSSRLTIPIDTDVNVGGTMEYAGSDFQDDINNPQRQFEDWSTLGTGSINISGFHLTAKYYNIGPYFYSPAAQTNAYTPGNGSSEYINNDMYGEDEGLINVLNEYPIQSAGRPSYAAYDRMDENILPYGDATPNREGMVAGLTIDIGHNGWLKPQASWDPNISGLQMREIQPNYVLNSAGNGVTSVDGNNGIRTFSGYEGALTVNFAKAFDLKDKIYQIQLDYKNQVTDLGSGLTPFTVNTFIAATDFNVPIKGFDSVVLSASYEQANANGSEYVLTEQGDPPTLANYAFYLDTPGGYTYSLIDIQKTAWSLGWMYPLSKTINFRMDYFYVTYTGSDTESPAYASMDRRDEILRFTYEVKF